MEAVVDVTVAFLLMAAGTTIGVFLGAWATGAKRQDAALRMQAAQRKDDLRETFFIRLGTGSLTIGELHRLDVALRARTNGMFGAHNMAEAHPAENVLLAMRDADLIPERLTMDEVAEALGQIGKDST